MIIGNLTNDKIQVFLQNNKYFNSAIKIISNTDFSKTDDGTYYVDENNFFYNIITYKTKNNTNEVKAEIHKLYIDFQYIIYGEELVGYSGSSNHFSQDSDYNTENDVLFLNTVSNESFFIIKRDMFCIFYPGEIHKPGIKYNETRSVRKAVFKVKQNLINL